MCHVDRDPLSNEGDEEDVELLIHKENFDRDFEEWQVFSWLAPPSSVNILDLDNIGKRVVGLDIGLSTESIIES